MFGEDDPDDSVMQMRTAGHYIYLTRILSLPKSAAISPENMIGMSREEFTELLI
jgi:hypothetical protein